MIKSYLNPWTCSGAWICSFVIKDLFILMQSDQSIYNVKTILLGKRSKAELKGAFETQVELAPLQAYYRIFYKQNANI